MTDHMSDLSFDLFDRSNSGLTKSNSTQPIPAPNFNLTFVPYNFLVNFIALKFYFVSLWVSCGPREFPLTYFSRGPSKPELDLDWALNSLWPYSFWLYIGQKSSMFESNIYEHVSKASIHHHYPYLQGNFNTHSWFWLRHPFKNKKKNSFWFPTIIKKLSCIRNLKKKKRKVIHIYMNCWTKCIFT